MRGNYTTSVMMFLLSPLWVAMANAKTPSTVDNVEFDPSMLMTLPNQPKIDIRRFNQSGAVSAGNYRLDIYVNEKWRGLADVAYVDDKDNLQQNAQLCVTDDLIKKWDTKPDIEQQLLAQSTRNGCHDFTAILQNAQAVLDLSAMRLNINIPQIYLLERPDDYADPATWDKGVNSAFASYQFNHYRTDNDNDQHYENYLGLNTGANIGRWHWRHQGWAKNDNKNHDTHYQTLNTYVSTDIPNLQSQLTLGDFYSDSNLFDGYAMRGIQMATDDRMLPPSLQGFAPTIHGIANSNAKVSIFQNNQEIYSTTVPAGAFELSNIRDIGSSGDLTVVITESDGRQTRQILPYNSAISLLRPNRYRYSIASGRVRHGNNHLYDDYLAQGTWQQGLTNAWTVNSGLLYSPNYRSALLGSAFNTPIGAFAINAIGVQYAPYEQSQQNGHQIRLQYHRLLPQTQTHINASVRYYHNYRNLDNVLRSYEEQQNSSTPLPKYRYQVSISQPLGKKWGSLYGFFSRTTNDDNLTQNQWQLGYSHHIGSLSYGISAQNTKYDFSDKWERQYLVNVSMALGGKGRHHLNGYYTKTDDYSQLQTGISGTFENLPHFDYGLTVSQQDKPSQTSWSANANYQLPLAKISGSYSDYDKGQQYSVGASGAMVLHQGGLTGANHLGETFAIVHLPNGKGATLESSDNVMFNRQGYAILPNLSPYRLNNLTVNPQGLPYEVQLDDTGNQVVPVANASVLVKFNSTVGRMALLNVKLANGKYPTMGANVYDSNMTTVGFVAQDGRVFLQDAKDSDNLQIRWGDNDSSQCQLDYQLPTATPNNPISTVNVVCH